mmetsp:Transcript_6506/g.15451  ORF Transcript_6506/g.15451 Transcript_6506/m.15451 type:complete len:227 (+) Transcript_6506:556-1236(+)
MHAPDVQRVVGLQPLAQLATEVTGRAGDHANDKGAPGLNKASSGGNGREARDGTHALADKGRLLVLGPVDDHPHEAGHRTSNLSVDGCSCGQATSPQGRAAVEAKPTKPEDRRACSYHGDVVGHIKLLLAHARWDVPAANDEQAGKCRKAGRDVHDDAAGKVPHSPLGHPAAAPHPMAERSVHNYHPKGNEDHVGAELEPVREAAGHQGRGDHGKHALVAREQEVR